MGCKTNYAGVSSIPTSGIELTPILPVAESEPTPSSVCSSDPSETDTAGTSSTATTASCPTGLPFCSPESVDPVSGNPLCSTCLPPDAVMIAATPRDPYYVDELAVALQGGDQTVAVRIKIHGNIPLVRPIAFRHSVLPGTGGVPDRVRADIETHELEQQSINMYSTIPQEDSDHRDVAVIDRYNNRWVIISSDTTEPRTINRRMTSAYFSRGRGVAPWWKTGYPDGTNSTGVG